MERQFQLTRISAAMFTHVFQTAKTKSDIRIDVHRLGVCTDNHALPLQGLLKANLAPYPEKSYTSRCSVRTGVGGASLNQRQKRLGSYPGAFCFPPYVAELAFSLAEPSMSSESR